MSVVKNEPNVDLAAAWKEAYRRGYASEMCNTIVRNREVPQGLVNALSYPTRPRAKTRLSRRENEILFLASVGWEKENISAALHLSEHTVKAHLRNIHRKLKAKNRTHAVAIAIRTFQLI